MKHYGKKKINRPNYFIGLQIDSQEIKANIESVQKEIKMIHPKLSSCCIDLSTLHLSCFMLCLKNNQEVAKANKLLNLSRNFLPKELTTNSLQISFEGINKFGRNKVIYAVPQRCQQLCLLTSFLERLFNLFKSENLTQESSFNFEPHLTIFKLSKDLDTINELNQTRKHYPIENEIYQDLHRRFRSLKFGETIIQSYEVLSMREKDINGYYRRIASYPFIELHDDQERK